MADDAYNYMKDEAAKGAVVLFVGTKKNKLKIPSKKKLKELANTTLTIVG